MRVCTRCSEHYEHYGQKAALCRGCRTVYNREYYHQRLNKTKMLEGKQRRRKETRQAIYDYLKEHPCVECGESDPVVLDFDHLDKSQKTYNVANMLTCSFETIETEILKCRVLCANCHRRRTAEQFGWYKDLT